LTQNENLVFYSIIPSIDMHLLNDDKLKFVAIYARVSTTNQETEGTIETQIHAIKEFALKNNLKIVEQYLDQGWSGSQLARPALDQMRMDAKKGRWQAVLMYDPDRLARRYSYQELVIDELKEIGIQPLFVTIAPSKNEEDKLLYGVRGIFAEYERVKITERFRLGRIRKASEGHIVISQAPYGYSYVKRQGTPGSSDFKQGHLIINQVEANVLRQIFYWIAERGLTQRQVIRKLQEENIPPRRSKRGVWSTSTVSRILRNTTYIGLAYYGSTYCVIPKNPRKNLKYRKTKKTSRMSRPKEERIAIKVPALINKEQFNKVQQQLAINKLKAKRNSKHPYLLQSRVWCVCGSRRSGYRSRTRLYYGCNDRAKTFPLQRKCSEKAVNARITDELIWNGLIRMLCSPDELNEQVLRWRKGLDKRCCLPVFDSSRMKNEIESFNKQIKRITRAYAEGIIDLKGLQDLCNPIKVKQQELVQQLKAQTNEKEPNPIRLPSLKEINNFSGKMRRWTQITSFETRRAVFIFLVEKVTATSKNLVVQGHLSLDDTEMSLLCSRHTYDMNTIRAEKPNRYIPFKLNIEYKKDRRK
jgi:site-specific DNA recombinase